MAKQKSASGDSNFDISRWLDLDDEQKVKVDSSESYGLDFTPLTKEEITTANLDVNLTVSIDSYIASGRVPRAEKKKLYALANVNAHAEGEVKNLEAFIVSNSGSYHSIVSGILKGNSELERTTLNDDDPYSAESISIDDTSSNAKANVAKADALFGEIHDLEGKRAMLNRQRKAKLEEMLEVVSKRSLSGYAPLIAVVTDKISGIDNVQDVTRAKITLEDERNFEKDAKEFQKYISGGFDPLADDDEDDGPLGEYVRNVDNFDVETPLGEMNFTEEEIRTIDSAPATASLETFGELFGVEDTALPSIVEPNSQEGNVTSDSSGPKPSNIAKLYAAGRNVPININASTQQDIRALWEEAVPEIASEYSTDISNILNYEDSEWTISSKSIDDNLSAEESEDDGNNINSVEAAEAVSPDVLEGSAGNEAIKDSSLYGIFDESIEWTFGRELPNTVVEVDELPIDEYFELPASRVRFSQRTPIFEELVEEYGIDLNFTNNS